VNSRILALLIAAGSVAWVAQTYGDQQPPQPTFRTEANYVRVDVYPTKDGMPVTDLTQGDFEILEERAPQKIEQFEHVVIRGGQPQETRVEPNTVAESRAMAQSSRARIFVLFLDTYHVDVAGSHNIRQPLTQALDRVIGPDDLVGVMTPEMSPNDITFARKTTTIDGFLTRYWHWGEKDRAIPADEEDVGYGFCYPNVQANDRCADQNGVAAEMIDRRHEKRALDALHDLVISLRGLREERKAILAITNGWLLYRSNHNLMRPLTCHGMPSGPPLGVDPRGGRLTTKPLPGYADEHKCEIDRINLAQIDNDRTFKDILDEANAANASFYPIDPRGLPVFDTPIMRTDVPGQAPPPVPLEVDAAMLRGRLESLRTLAEATDGIAIVNSNNLDAGFKRVVADLSSYYLLGYYSTGKLDGRFHSISVRVKRPGVQVRARRGYLAATPRAINAAAATAASTAAEAEAHAMDVVLSPLNAFTRELPIRIQAASGYTARGPAAVWVVGELGTGEEWKSGAEVDVMLTASGGTSPPTLAAAHATVPIGAHSFRVALTPTSPLAPGDYAVRVRARGGASSMSTNETAHVVLSAAPAATGAVLIRRGPATGNKEIATADLRFRRSEQIRLEVPVSSDAAATARLLDRTGKALAIPVTAAIRDDADGSKWQTAQLALAPLAPGDYVVEISRAGGAGGAGGAGTTTRTLVAFRVVP